MVKAWSKTQACITLSSAEAELVAATRAASEALGCANLLRDFGIEPQVYLGMDSSAAIAMLEREGLGRSRHIDTQYMWVQGKIRSKQIVLNKIPTAYNPSDIFTKPLPEDTLMKHMLAMGYVFSP